MPGDGASVNPGQFYRNLVRLEYREVIMSAAVVAVTAAAVGLFPGFDNLTAGLDAGVGPVILLALLGVVTVGALTKGTVGFGFSLVATPLFATVIDPRLAVIVLAIPPWMINLFQIGDTRTGWSFLRREWPLVSLTVGGTIVGVFILSSFHAGASLRFIIAVMLVGYVAFQVVSGFLVVERAHHPVALGGVGLVQGLLVAIANFGPVLPAYFHVFERDPERYIGGLSMVFTLTFTVKIGQMYALGLLTPYRIWLGSTVSVVAIGGLLLGTYLRRLEIDRRRFNWFVMVLLAAIAIQLFRSSIPRMLS